MRFTTVKRAISAVLLDKDDADARPEVESVQGQVTFTPMLGDGDSVQVQTVDGPVTVVLSPITVRISDGMVMHRGAVGVQLFAGGEGSEPSLIRWRASFSNLQSQGVPFTLRDVIFDAVPDGIVDLTTAAPLANAPEPIIRGPQGVSIAKLTVEGGDLVVWGTSESGTTRLSTVPMAEFTTAAAQQAADETKAEFAATLGTKAERVHTHVIADTTGLQAALDGKANSSHTHSTSQVTGLDTALAGKANAAHTHAIADTTGLQAALDGKAVAGHKHTSADVTDAASTPSAGMVVKYGAGGLFTVGAPTATDHPATKKYVDDGLAGKAPTSHTHTTAQVTGLQSALDGKAAKSHTHTTAQVTGLDNALASKATQADMVALQQKLAALTAPITVFQGSHKMSSGTLQAQTPRMYGTVTITVNQSGPENQAGLVQPRIFDHTGTRYTESMGGWEKTGGGAGTAYKYLTDMAAGKTITLTPGYYIDGIEIYSWQTGANTVTKISVQN